MSSSRLHLTLPVLASALVLGLPAAATQAKTYCVKNPACPAGGIAKASLDSALNDADGADANPDSDEIVFGPGVFELKPLKAERPVTIRGAGMGRTWLGMKPGATVGLALADGASSVSDLSVQINSSHVYGAVKLLNGADATRVEVRSTESSSEEVTGIVATHGGSVLSQGKTDLQPTPFGEGVWFLDGGELRDSDVAAAVGVTTVANGTPTKILRSTIRASVGLNVSGGTAVARNVLVTPNPHEPAAARRGVQAVSSDGNTGASLTASHLTLIGSGATGVGVLAENGGGPSGPGQISVNLSDSVVRGYETSLTRHGAGVTQGANLGVSYSGFDAGAVIDEGTGKLSTVTGNLDGLPDARFVNAPAGDYRLRFDSPLIDRGNGSSQGTDIEGDRNGNPRVVDGNGNGKAARDIGAFEYGRRAPVAAFSFSPSWPALIAEPVAFSNTTTDADGDPLAYAWQFGDGAGAGTVNATHAFGSAGRTHVTLVATDPTNLSSEVAHDVSVTAPGDRFQHRFPAAPRVSGVSMLRRRFAVTKPSLVVSAGARGAVKRGTRFRFTLSSPGRPAVAVNRVTIGRVGKGRRCVAATRSNAKAKRCRILTQLPETKGRAQGAGPGSIDFTGYLRGKALRPGAYEAYVLARDSEAQMSNQVRVPFTIVKGR